MKFRAIAFSLTVLLVACSPLVQAETRRTPAPAPIPRTAETPQPVDLSAPLSSQIVPYNSTVMGGQRSYGVVLPPGYAQHPQQRYPVIFLLHGGHGDETDWLSPQKGNALPTLQRLYQAGKLPLSIVITVDGNDDRGSNPHFDPDYFDGPHGKVATAIGDELVRVIKSRYRTSNDPRLWAMGGLSSGGWGAVNVGLSYRQNFGVLFSHSGYFTDRSGAANSPMARVRSLPRMELTRLRFYMDAGENDGRYLRESQQFSQVLTRLGVRNQFNQFPGSHSWQYWRSHLADSLTYVGSAFAEAQGTASVR